jgi:hypothetical protein
VPENRFIFGIILKELSAAMVEIEKAHTKCAGAGCSLSQGVHP